MVYVGGMKHEPSPLRAEVPKLPADATDEDLEEWLCALPPCPGIGFADDDDADEDAEIDGEIAAQDWVPHEIVVEWLAIRREPGRLSFDEWLAARNA